jgi:hypothetical protein
MTELHAGTLPSVIYKHHGVIEYVAWSPISRMVASCGLEDGVHVWDPATRYRSPARWQSKSMPRLRNPAT